MRNLFLRCRSSWTKMNQSRTLKVPISKNDLEKRAGPENAFQRGPLLVIPQRGSSRNNERVRNEQMKAPNWHVNFYIYHVKLQKSSVELSRVLLGIESTRRIRWRQPEGSKQMSKVLNWHGKFSNFIRNSTVSAVVRESPKAAAGRWRVLGHLRALHQDLRREGAAGQLPQGIGQVRDLVHGALRANSTVWLVGTFGNHIDTPNSTMPMSRFEMEN